MSDSTRVAAYKLDLQDCPTIAWETPVDEHLTVLQQWWLETLCKHFPRLPRHQKRREDFLSQNTWDLIQARKKQLTRIHRISQMRQALELVVCFKAWAHLRMRDRTS
eukprot:14619706-Alexandrium_andersonii.AAC.1